MRGHDHLLGRGIEEAGHEALRVVPQRDVPAGVHLDVTLAGLQAVPLGDDTAVVLLGRHEGPLAEDPAIGMWKDREDMKDSAAWVRRQREQWSERLTREE